MPSPTAAFDDETECLHMDEREESLRGNFYAPCDLRNRIVSGSVQKGDAKRTVRLLSRAVVQELKGSACFCKIFCRLYAKP